MSEVITSTDRKTAIKVLTEIALELAEEYNYTHLLTYKHACGMWDKDDVKLSQIVEQEFGEDMTEWRLCNPTNPKEYVGIRYWVSNPTLSVGVDTGTLQDLLMLIEIGDSYIDPNPLKSHNYDRDGKYTLKQVTSWTDEGFTLAQKLVKQWKYAIDPELEDRESRELLDTISEALTLALYGRKHH